MTESNVNHPAHYTQGIECIDYIESHKMDFREGGIIKYVTRYKDKNGVEDLKKARWFIDRLIAGYEKDVPLCNCAGALPHYPCSDHKPLDLMGNAFDMKAFEEQQHMERVAGVAKALPDYDIFDKRPSEKTSLYDGRA